jgi:carboxypeptidase C (cathepsin A)
LVYSGDLDFICNYLGGKAWVSQMDWSGKSQYNAAPQKDWTVAGKKAGWSKSYQGLTFLAVHEAGHMCVAPFLSCAAAHTDVTCPFRVPMDQPQAALAMLETVLTGKQF